MNNLTNISMVDFGNDVLTLICSYSNEQDLTSLAKTCKKINAICYLDQFPLAEKRLDKFFPEFKKVKPENISFAKYYEQLHTFSGILYAIKKDYQINEARFNPKKIVLICDIISCIIMTPMVPAQSLGLINFYVSYLSESYEDENNYKFLKEWAPTCRTITSYGYLILGSYVSSAFITAKLDEKLKIFSTGYRSLRSLAFGIQFGRDLLSKKKFSFLNRSN